MPDAARVHRQTEARLHALARRTFPVGAYHVDLRHLAALGGGSMEAGEAVLNKLFEGHMVGPRSIAVSGLRALGNGNTTAGRKVLQKFIAKLRARHQHADEPQPYAEGGDTEKPPKIFGEPAVPGYEQLPPLDLGLYSPITSPRDIKPKPKAFGGPVGGKLTKAAANYRDATGDEICAECSMFRPLNHSCSLIEGKISRTSVCDFYEPRESAVHG